ncbi:hypothetical protein LH51_14765 [Nitrincola sp. A-D6]|uniref:NUDIX domain-containing protein n=1 Tax=Nitrincola sp. A-D6 TaxID=1545442 RepID=UPI00051FCD84|nr:NUDIX domain-containing protein [Nitrincola sp. A-D6]KGK41413.1 hypothetical protein LH51_14765 [Nitrincola sp. A-D6]
MKNWQPAFTQQDVRVKDDRCVYNGFFKMHQLQLQHARFDGEQETVTREIFRRGNAVAVLLLDPQHEELVLIEQFRPGALAAPGGPWLLELVAGMIESDESAVAVAERETLEEAGLAVQYLTPIMGYLPSPGGMDEWIHLLYGFVDASAAEGLHGLADEGEDIRVLRLAVNDVFELLDAGQLNNGAIIIAVQWLKLNYPSIRERGVGLIQRDNEA